MESANRHPRVLVVEDNAVTRKLVQDTLELEGYEVVCAEEGGAALKEIGATRPDVIVLDAMMPGIDGFTVLSKLRNDPATADLPVLMLTALDDTDSTWKGWAGGCHYYMTKPFEIEDLLSAVGRLASGVLA